MDERNGGHQPQARAAGALPLTRLVARLAKLERGRGLTALANISDAALEARIVCLTKALGYWDEWRDLFPDPSSAALGVMISTVRRDADACA